MSVGRQSTSTSALLAARTCFFARRLLLFFGIVAAVSACASHPPRPAPAAPSPSVEQRLAEADDLVRAGCFACLLDALARYRQLLAESGDALDSGRVRDAAGLLAIRERVLGLTDHGYLDQAREAGGNSDATHFDVIPTIPRRLTDSSRVGDEAQIEALMRMYPNRQAWRARLADMSGTGPLAAVTAITFECVHGRSGEGAVESLLDRVGPWKNTAVIQFAAATCAGFEADGLTRLLDANPRFAEINYFLGVAATLKGDLDEAERRFQRAFEWRQEWPALTLALANVAMSIEDFERAADSYARTLAIIPGNPDALFGRARALSYAGRYDDALAAANALLAEGRWYVGDARYWRAWNEAQLNRNDEAWADVHEAAKLVVNAEVPKLTGILAVRRGDLPTARAEFAAAHLRNAADCESPVLLAGVHLELGQWTAATPILLEAIGCLDRHDEELRAEIDRLHGVPGRERVATRREQELAADQRLRAQSWFNLAVASFNVGDRARAREYAEHVAGDDRFGERARRLIAQLKP